ncbi:MAG: hypothetical protein D6731_25045 [Planctomycetota bacterium]|nr:MAG: hypothetical protein D6731_25045 [Planctomycetota bacterium]
MFPQLAIPSPLIGAVLLAVGGLWIRHWRRKEDPEERKVWQFGVVLCLAGAIGISNVLGTIRWGTYGFMTMAGCVAVTVLGVRWNLRHRLLGMEHTIELLLITGVCGLLGARAVFLVEQWDVHFADRPPILRVGLLPPGGLSAGDELRLLVHGRDRVVVRFRGDERSLTDVVARIEEQAGAHDVVARIVTTQHRGPEGVEVRERGLLLETGRTGSEASLSIDPACAFARRLGPISGTPRGVDVPWLKTLDLRMGGQTYFGAVIGVLISGLLYLRWRKARVLGVLDALAPTLPLGLFFGRLGCLGYGCCWGRELPAGSALPGLSFPRWSPAWRQMLDERLSCNYDPLVTQVAKSRGTLPPELEARLGEIAQGTPPLHAAQLYEGLAVLGVALVAYLFRERWRTREGQTFALVVLLQAPIRFVVEHLRRDHDVFWSLAGYPMTESQTAAVLAVAGAVGFLVWLRRHGRAPAGAAKGTEAGSQVEAAALPAEGGAGVLAEAAPAAPAGGGDAPQESGP